MDDRIHRYLDGELPWTALDAEERAEARRFESAVEELRQDHEAFTGGDIAGIVMERVAAVEAEARGAVGASSDPSARDSLLHGLVRWLFGKRELSLTLRPAWVVAALALLAGAGAWWGGIGGAARVGPVEVKEAVTEASGEPRVYVRFELRAPEAESVKLAGSFSGWSPDIDLRRMPDGRWAALVPLSPGVHDYAFRVDGERWTTDPSAPRIADGFGGYNSRLSLVLADS